MAYFSVKEQELNHAAGQLDAVRKQLSQIQAETLQIANNFSIKSASATALRAKLKALSDTKLKKQEQAVSSMLQSLQLILNQYDRAEDRINGKAGKTNQGKTISAVIRRAVNADIWVNILRLFLNSGRIGSSVVSGWFKQILTPVTEVASVVPGASSSIWSVRENRDNSNVSGVVQGQKTGTSDSPVNDTLSSTVTVQNTIQSDVNTPINMVQFNKDKYEGYLYKSDYSDYYIMENLDPTFITRQADFDGKSYRGCYSSAIALAKSISTGTRYDPRNYWSSKNREAVNAGTITQKVADSVSVEQTYQVTYEQLKLGNPVVLRVQNSKGTGHSVTVVGLNKNVDSDNLNDGSFLIVDPNDGKIKTLEEYRDSKACVVNDANGSAIKTNDYYIVVPN